MVIIPLTNKLSWRNPPVATIGIIILNCIIFFMLQTDENRLYHQALDYYFSSGLAEIEIPRYLKYLEHKTALSAPPSEDGSPDKQEMHLHFKKMQEDSRFLKQLRTGQIITDSEPEYARWKELRQTYDEKLSRVMFISYGLRPAYRTPVTFLSHMFLHGGLSHLIGNMIFLWIVGCMLELGCGRLLYIALYLITGFVAAGLFCLAYLSSTTPLVGASGAISGLMGILTVLYGRKKINIFFSLGFYFNYLKVPAILLLPVWMGNELFQLLFGGVSQVAYMAHIGGLLGGAGAGFAVSRFPRFLNEDIFKEEPEDEISPLLEKALQQISTLNVEEGRALLVQILEKDPRHVQALRHLFSVDKQTPDTPRFHQTAATLLSHLLRNRASHPDAYAVYQEYLEHTAHPRLSPDLYVRLSLAFSGLGHPEAAAKILMALVKKMPRMAGLPTALLKLADAYGRNGMAENRRKCRQAICARYPDSPEARIIKTSQAKK